MYKSMDRHMESALKICHHSFENTTLICIAQDCDDRFLCDKCSKQHNRFHSVSIKSVSSILEYNPKAQITNVTQLLDEYEARKEAVYTHYFYALDKIKEEINNGILLIRQQIQAEFENTNLKNNNLPQLTASAEKLSSFTQNCMKNASICFKNNSKDHIEEHILRYIQFHQDLEKINESANFSSIKSLSYKELQKQINILLQNTNETLNTFTNTYFKGSNNLDQDISSIKELAKPHIPHQNGIIKNTINNKVQKDIVSRNHNKVPNENIPPKFDIKKLQKEFILKLPAMPGWNSIEYIPDHNLVTIGDELGNLEFWTSTTWECLFVERFHLEKINAVKYSKKTHSIITVSNDRTIKVFHTRNPPQIDQITLLTEHIDKVWSLLVLENHDMFYSSGKEPCIIGWDLNTLQVKHKISTRGRDTTGTEMAFIERLKLLVVSFKSGTISFYNIETPSEVRSINVYQKWLHCLKYIEERDQLVVGVDVGTIKVWQIGNDSYQCVKGYKIPGKLPIGLTSISEGKEVLIATECSKLVLLNLETGECKKSHNFDLQGVKSLKYIPELQKVLVASNEAEISVLKY